MMQNFEFIERPPITSQEKPPLLVMLHGYGSNKEDLFGFAPILPDAFHIVSIQAPHRMADFGYAWYAIHFDNQNGKWSDDAQAVASRDALANFISGYTKQVKADPEKVFILGFSQGAILAYALAFSYPNLFKGIVALSGYLNTNIIDKKDGSGFPKIYASHGEQDVVVPFDWALKTANTLNEWNVKHIFESYPVGHTVSQANFLAFKQWLESELENI